MEEKDYFKLIDRIADVALINLFSISKASNIIRLSDVRLNDDKHWALLNLVSNVCTLMDRVAFLEMPLWQYIRLQFRLRNRRLKRVRNITATYISCDDFINHIENANETLIKDPFLELTKAYYPRKRG